MPRMEPLFISLFYDLKSPDDNLESLIQIGNFWRKREMQE